MKFIIFDLDDTLLCGDCERYWSSFLANKGLMKEENNSSKINQFDEDYRNKVISQTMLKKVGEADDIAKAIEFLLLNSPFITGQILNVDGGRSFSSD